MPRDLDVISPADVVAAFRYDPESGSIFRLESKRTDTVGEVPRIVQTGGYLVVYAFGRLVRAHRLAWVLMTGKWPENDIDHINRDRADNRWCNLREATRAENLRNTGPRKTSATGFKCVERSGRRFVAYMREDGRKRYLGTFDPLKRQAPPTWLRPALTRLSALKSAPPSPTFYGE